MGGGHNKTGAPSVVLTPPPPPPFTTTAHITPCCRPRYWNLRTVEGFSLGFGRDLVVMLSWASAGLRG